MPNFRCFRQRKNEKSGVAAAKKFRFIGFQKLPCVEEAFVLYIRSEYIRRFFIRLESPNFQSMPKRFENRKAASGLRYLNRVFLRRTLVKIWFAAVLCLPPLGA